MTKVEKVLSTHVMVAGVSIVHVVGDREDVLAMFEEAEYSGTGLDLQVAGRTEPGPYKLSRLRIGAEQVRMAIIADAHEIEVSDEPYVPVDNEDVVPNKPLEAVL